MAVVRWILVIVVGAILGVVVFAMMEWTFNLFGCEGWKIDYEAADNEYYCSKW